MGSDQTNVSSLAQPTGICRWTYIRRKTIPLRRRRLPAVRLGGKKPRRGLFLVRLVRRMRLRWLRLQYTFLLKKLKSYYATVKKEMMEAGGTLDAFHQRLLLETSFAVPVMGLSFNNFSPKPY